MWHSKYPYRTVECRPGIGTRQSHITSSSNRGQIQWTTNRGPVSADRRQRVYQHALNYFTEDDIAEAFAVTHGVASPTQLRAVLKQDGRDLVAQFRALAPERRPVAIKHWSLRRVGLSLPVLALAVVAVLVVVHNWAVIA
jgi:hypothetical protein